MMTPCDASLALDRGVLNGITPADRSQPADRNMHQEMGVHDRWGTVVEQLAKLVERQRIAP
jgi:hypothetical protein